jgi:hypothetical protein
MTNGKENGRDNKAKDIVRRLNTAAKEAKGREGQESDSYALRDPAQNKDLIESPYVLALYLQCGEPGGRGCGREHVFRAFASGEDALVAKALQSQGRMGFIARCEGCGKDMLCPSFQPERPMVEVAKTVPPVEAVRDQIKNPSQKPALRILGANGRPV